jgi:antitoxin ParD1/3/4
MPSSYTIGSHFEKLVDGLVESGRYNNASEVVREGLRLLEDREKLRDISMTEMRNLAEEGRLGGLSDQDGEEFLDKLAAKYRAMIESSSQA